MDRKTEQGIADIKKALEDKKVIIGTDRTLVAIKKGQVKVVYLTQNCPEEVRQDVAHYSKLAQVNVIELAQPNDELGAICRKPFSVSVVSIKG